MNHTQIFHLIKYDHKIHGRSHIYIFMFKNPYLNSILSKPFINDNIIKTQMFLFNEL